MVKRGKNRSRYQSDVDTSLSNEIVWTQKSSDPQVDAMDVAFVLEAFTGANFHAVNTLNKEFDKKKEEIIILKEELNRSKNNMRTKLLIW